MYVKRKKAWWNHILRPLQNLPGAPASCRRVVISSTIRRLESGAPSVAPGFAAVSFFEGQAGSGNI